MRAPLGRSPGRPCVRNSKNGWLWEIVTVRGAQDAGCMQLCTQGCSMNMTK